MQASTLLQNLKPFFRPIAGYPHSDLVKILWFKLRELFVIVIET